MNRILDLFKLRFNFERDTIIAFSCGFLVIFLSFTMNFFKGESLAGRVGIFFIRDFLMIFGFGVVVPFHYTILKKEPISKLGFKKERWKISLVVNIFLGILLLILFLNEGGVRGEEVFLNSRVFGSVLYIMVAGIFEVIFFYGFLMEKFESAFGIIPGIILASLFYSLHHVGFQPEFPKLFFVGLMYSSVFRLTRNFLIVYPFFWGVGATWDVLVQFEGTVENGGIRGIAIFTLMVLYVFYLRKRY